MPQRRRSIAPSRGSRRDADTTNSRFRGLFPRLTCKNSRFNGNLTGAARSSSVVGDGVLPVPLIAPRRRIDRLGQLGSAERGGFALRGGVGVERRALARLAVQ